MLYHKENYPEVSEIVLCTVDSIKPHAVFTTLDEYGKTGMIHISEIAPGRIRNLREYVKEGKKVVCKVLGVNLERGHIDLSLRRVNEKQRRAKIEFIKQEQKAEKIVEFLSNRMKEEFNEFYSRIAKKIFAEYDSLHECFDDVVAGNVSLGKLGIEPKTADELDALIIQRLKPEEVEIKGYLTLTSYAPNGVEIIRETLSKACEDSSVSLHYIGAGRYNISVKAKEYKIAESVMKSATDKAISYLKSRSGIAEFTRA